ncbi:MAG: ATP-binding cassette domain-containing protein, partial [Synergistaceae bacterium]|nr:ATP-binding cassette domain-containing protein [Synergistaceae bacterium]
MGNSSYLILASNISKVYGDRTIFKINSLRVNNGDRVGLVGANGSGKSTLLAVLAGELEPDEGSVDSRGSTALVRQTQDADALRRGGADVFGRRVFEFAALSDDPSGGELSRAALSAAFASEPDVLLADEPTTNLDWDGIEQLRRALSSFRGAVVLVSHDRSLLDDLCCKIWELENGALRTFPGNYSGFRIQKQREREFAASEYETSRREKKRLAEAARKVLERQFKVLKAPSRMSPSEARIASDKGVNAQAALHSRAKALGKRASMVGNPERPPDLPEIKMALGACARIASDITIRARGMSVSFGERVIFEDADFEVRTNSHTILLGPNGSGKSTLIKLVEAGHESIKIAPGARIGYFSQNHETIDMSRTVLENARQFSERPEHEVRTILARLEIKGDAV